eukprot:scaffold1376_cov257-Pinguiococcus_pyrenoidosus.AAC.25
MSEVDPLGVFRTLGHPKPLTAKTLDAWWPGAGGGGGRDCLVLRAGLHVCHSAQLKRGSPWVRSALAGAVSR